MLQGRKSINSNPHFFKLKLDSDIKQKEYSETIKQLQKNEVIDYITPYYKTLQGDTVTISNMLYAKLNNVADTVLLKKYCSENNLLVVKQDDFMPQWFLLSVCTDTTKNALELANQLYENGIVKYAEPDFIGGGGSSQGSQTGPNGFYWTIPKGRYTIEVRIVTQCGHYLTTATVGGYSAKTYPNPVEQTLFVDIDNPIEHIPATLSASTRKAPDMIFGYSIFRVL